MEEPPPPGSLPDLPPAVATEALKGMDEAALGALDAGFTEAERAIRAAMAPFERQLRELRARMAELATERRRRERAVHIAQRAAVRAGAGSGELPTLADALGAAEVPLPDATPLAEVPTWLASGGAVAFGFPSRPGVLSFTDGRGSRQATTLGMARTHWAEGWEPGAPGVPGVRVHLVGTRIERVVAATDVVVRLTGPDGEEPGGSP